MADGDPGAGADPFAAAKANLRDTIKWLATTFAGLGAAVLAGASITGISGLQGSTLWFAAVTGGLGLVCVFATIGVLLRLLTSESFFLSQLDDKKYASIKATLAKNSDDFLSPAFVSLEQFLSLRRDAIADIRKPQTTQSDRDNHTKAVDFFKKIAGESSRLVNFAHLEALRANLKKSEATLFLLAMGAVAGLGAFAIIVGEAKGAPSSSSPAMTLEFSPGKDWNGLRAAFAGSCNSSATLKAELIASPQPGWVRVRLLTPQACAGMQLDVPATLVSTPQI